MTDFELLEPKREKRDKTESRDIVGQNQRVAREMGAILKVGFLNKYVCNLHLKDSRESAGQMSSGSLFHEVGVSNIRALTTRTVEPSGNSDKFFCTFWPCRNVMLE